ITAACNDGIDKLVLAVNRTKKAYRDAIDLIAQYDFRKGNGQAFPPGFCQDLIGDPPPGFPPGDCAHDSAAATINRFTQFYRNEIINELRPAFDAIAASAPQLHAQLPASPPPTRQSETIFEATF